MRRSIDGTGRNHDSGTSLDRVIKDRSLTNCNPRRKRNRGIETNCFIAHAIEQWKILERVKILDGV